MSEGHVMIEWDRDKLSRFRAAVLQAKARNNDQFRFEGHEFVVGYAEYLIEFLDDRLAHVH